jgi:hypothetical protein
MEALARLREIAEQREIDLSEAVVNEGSIKMAFSAINQRRNIQAKKTNTSGHASIVAAPTNTTSNTSSTKPINTTSTTTTTSSTR